MAKSQRGFTLIELLMAISIIGLLSSIVLASLGGARIRARNSARNSQLLEYTKALALYKADKGYFPKGTNPATDYYCLGTYSNPNHCDFYYGPWEVTDGDTEIKDALTGGTTKYLPSFPPVGGTRSIPGNDGAAPTPNTGAFTGADYWCGEANPATGDIQFPDETCRVASVSWFLEKPGVCARPANAVKIKHDQNDSIDYGAIVCEVVIE